VESQAILPQEQMDFRSNRSCTDSLITLTNNIHTNFLANDVVAAAFLDITGVFDVLPEVVLSEKIGVPARLRKFIENIITHRSVHFVEEGHLSEAYSVQKRIPQGSMLSPLLFNISVLEMDLQLHPGTNFLQYAN